MSCFRGEYIDVHINYLDNSSILMKSGPDPSCASYGIKLIPVYCTRSICMYFVIYIKAKKEKHLGIMEEDLMT